MSVHVRRFLLVLPLLAAGTALAAATIGVLDPRTLVGLRFVAAVFPALLAIDRLWGVGVELDVGISAATLISVSFPLLFVSSALVAGIIGPTVQLLGMIVVGVPILDPILPATMITSALGARFVAAALARLTKRQDRNLRRAMIAWAGCWPLLQWLYPPRARHFVGDAAVLEWLFPRSHTWFGPFSVLAWQIPIGLACVIWFLRAAPAPTRRAAASAT